MVGPFDLWLAVLVAAVLVFLVSSVLHMAIRLHKQDYRKLPGEEELMGAIRAQGVARGHYFFPHVASMKELSSPEVIQRFERGPVGVMTVFPNGMPRMGKSLVQWFLFSVLVGFLVAYVASVGLTAGAPGTDVFRLTFTAAFLGYSSSYVVDSIWKGLSWGITAKFMLDGLLYALATAASFAWLWPGA